MWLPEDPFTASELILFQNSTNSRELNSPSIAGSVGGQTKRSLLERIKSRPVVKFHKRQMHNQENYSASEKLPLYHEVREHSTYQYVR